MKKIKVDLNEFLSAFSLALDLAESLALGSDDLKIMEHARRVSYIATSIAKKLNIDTKIQKRIYIAALLHDISIADALKECHEKEELISYHCEKGAEIVNKMPLDSSLKDVIKYHHEKWDGTGPFNLSKHDIPLESRIIHLADLFDLNFYSRKKEIIITSKAVEWINQNTNSFFDPEIGDVLLELILKDSLLLDLSMPNIKENLKKITPPIEIVIDIDGLKNMSHVLSTLIDNKSHFTYNHSQNVAQISLRIAKELNFDENKLKMIEIAGLLHDLGKLAIPTEILDKPGKLTAKEFEIIKTHPYYTRRILSEIKGFDEITNWAANHHEKLDGSGYPYSLKSEQLGLEDRIIAISDIYSALTQERPYRKVLEPLEALKIIEEEIKKDKLDSMVFNTLKRII